MFKVGFNYVSEASQTLADALIADVTTKGGQAISVRADMKHPGAPQKIIETTLSTFAAEHVDILVNNAGVAHNSLLAEVTSSDYDVQMQVNVRAVIFMTQAILPYLRPESLGNRIVNISSISARAGFATTTVYAACKAAVEGMTRVWAKELGQKYNVTVNAVNPGPVDTDMYRAAGEVHLARMAEENKHVPAAPRCGTESDVADIVAFLCTQRARWVTGDVVCANGGMLFF